jgi:hypothetical protein
VVRGSDWGPENKSTEALTRQQRVAGQEFLGGEAPTAFALQDQDA